LPAKASRRALSSRSAVESCKPMESSQGRRGSASLSRSGGSVVPMVQWPDNSLSLGLVQPLSWRRSGLMLQPATQISICSTIGGRHPGVCTELIYSANDNVGVICGYSHTASPSAHASISIGRSKLNGGATRSGVMFRVDAPLHGFGRPWFSVQMNSGVEF